jgi:hypothetical protein
VLEYSDVLELLQKAVRSVVGMRELNVGLFPSTFKLVAQCDLGQQRWRVLESDEGVYQHQDWMWMVTLFPSALLNLRSILQVVEGGLGTSLVEGTGGPGGPGNRDASGVFFLLPSSLLFSSFSLLLLFFFSSSSLLLSISPSLYLSLPLVLSWHSRGILDLQTSKNIKNIKSMDFLVKMDGFFLKLAHNLRLWVGTFTNQYAIFGLPMSC